MNSYHTSVLLQEAIEQLVVKPGEKYIDATLGGGEHTLEIARQGGEVLGIDIDEEAIQHVTDRIKNPPLAEAKGGKQELSLRERITLERGNFRDVDTIAKENGFEKVSGILFDLGVSSHQIDTPERGFSFNKLGPLDMRMGRDLTVSASDLINGLTKDELTKLFTKLGEERHARTIAKKIVGRRKLGPISTTYELAQLIEPFGRKSIINPATRVFQALRIAVNDELNILERTLPAALSLLNQSGRIVVISFHSLEDRIVKHSFIGFKEQGLGKIITNKPILPKDEEQESNRRSRSAKMRVFEKI